MNRSQLMEFIITPALDAMGYGMNTAAARKLLLFTCACESRLGFYIRQVPEGPALGIYQMERRTYYDVYDSVLRFNKDLKRRLLAVTLYHDEPPAEALMWDARLATVMARLQYWRWPEALPNVGDEDALVRYYFKYWAPNPDKTSVEEARIRIKKLIGDDYDK